MLIYAFKGATMKHKVIIIGSGFAGICMAIKLKAAGIDDFVILEKGSQVGGTWFFNRYPGAACDIPSMLYSFSFAPNPNFTRRYAPQNEIEDYIHSLVAQFDLEKHIKFNTAMTAAQFNDGRWQVTTEQGDVFDTQFLISAVGQLNHPQWPNIEGIETFEGESWHSATWREDVDLTDKTVAVVGSAASAVQLIPEVAKVAKKVVVLQRTPNYLIPRMDRAFLGVERWLFKRVPLLMKWHRLFTFTLLERLIFPSVRKTEWSVKLMNKIARWQLTRQIKDPALLEKLTPDFPMGCKRILICDDYYPALTRDNVELETAAIKNVDANGVNTDNGHHRADVIVFATGFKATDMLRGMDIRGRNGESLHDHWQQGAFAYRSVCTSNFPNLFFLYGPNSNLGSNSILGMIEAQVGFIMTLIKSGKPQVEVNAEAEQRHQTWLEDQLTQTIWHSGCNNWYRNEHGKQPLNWPLSAGAFKRHMKQVNWFDFEH